MEAAPPQQLLHITHARQDEPWVQGVLIPALGLAEDQFWTRAEDSLGALKLEELERAVESCRYTLLVASSAARADEWTQFAGLLAQHLGTEEGKPRLLVVTRDFDPESERARALLPLRQRCLVCLDCSDPERTKASLATLAAQLALIEAEELSTECPYPGLRTFGEGEPGSFFNRTDLFFGRDQEGREIVERLRGGGCVLVVGPSGCGKSSLLRARVLPALARGPELMAIIVARPGEHPDVELCAALDAFDPALVPATDAYLNAEDKEAALPALLAATTEIGLLLCVDQLEEVFLDDADEDDERASFFARLGALRSVPSMAILLSMRADFYGDLMRSPIWEEVKDHRVELAPLRGAVLRQAITRPAEVVGVHVEADLVERMVREADQDRAAEALPLLQVALEQLWKQREWRYLSLASYARIAEGERRGLDAVLARHADASIEALAEPMRVLARRVLLDLVHLGEGRPDTRRRRTESELRRAGDSDDALAEVLDHLSARRLIAVGAGEGPAIAERHVDLAHDTLISGWPELARWIAERRDHLVTQRRLEARAAGGGLLAASELPELTRWVAWIATPAGQALGASQQLVELVAASEAEHARVQREKDEMNARLLTEMAKARHSIGTAAKTAQLMVFDIDAKLRQIPGASPVRETLMKSTWGLLAELRRIGDLAEFDQRTAMAGKVAQAEIALEDGRIEEARLLYLEALADAQNRVTESPANALFQSDLSRSYIKLGDVAVTSGKLDDARVQFEQALVILEGLAAAEPANTEWQSNLGDVYTRLGEVRKESGNLESAQAWFEEALAVNSALVVTDPANILWRRDLSISHSRLGDVAMQSGRLDNARARFEQVLTILEALADTDATNSTWQSGLSVNLVKLGNVAVAARRLDDARARFEQALAKSKALADADTTNTEWKRDVIVSYIRLGDVEAASGKLAEAWEWFEQALATTSRLAGTDTTWQRDVIVSYDRLGEVALARGQLEDARRMFERAHLARRAQALEEPTSTEWQHELAIAYDHLGDVEAAVGNPHAAQRWYVQALEAKKALIGTDPANLESHYGLSVSYNRLGRVAIASDRIDEARQWYEESLGVCKLLAAADSPSSRWRRDLSITYVRLGDTWMSRDRRAEAQWWYANALADRQALASAEPANPVWQRGLSAVHLKLSGVAIASGKLDDARARFEESRAAYKAMLECGAERPPMPGHSPSDRPPPTWERSVSMRCLGEIDPGLFIAGGLVLNAMIRLVALIAGWQAGPFDKAGTFDWKNLLQCFAFGELMSGVLGAIGWILAATRAPSVGIRAMSGLGALVAVTTILLYWLESGILARWGYLVDFAAVGLYAIACPWRPSRLSSDLKDMAIYMGIPCLLLMAVHIAVLKQGMPVLGSVEIGLSALMLAGVGIGTPDSEGLGFEVISRMPGVLGEIPDNSTWHGYLVTSYERISDATGSSGKLDNARGWFEEKLAAHEAPTAPDSAHTGWQRYLGRSYRGLGDAAVKAGMFDSARVWFEKALAVYEELAAAEPLDPSWQVERALLYGDLGEVAVKAGAPDRARRWFEKALTTKVPASTRRATRPRWILAGRDQSDASKQGPQISGSRP